MKARDSTPEKLAATEYNSGRIKAALKQFKGQYRIINNGTESEAWLYKSLGFTTVEVDIPVVGGCILLTRHVGWRILCWLIRRSYRS
jgi:hypothetical protein